MDMIFELISNFFGIEPLGLAIVCGLVFLAGYVDAIAGGGGLISLPAYLIAGVPTHAAIATNKLSSCMGTTVATFHYAKSGFINARLALPSIVFAFLGSFCGSNVLLLVDDGFLRLFLLVVLPVTAIYVMKSKSFDAAGLQSFSLRKTTLLCMGIAFAVGVYDGFYGPGTGTFFDANAYRIGPFAFGLCGRRYEIDQSHYQFSGVDRVFDPWPSSYTSRPFGWLVQYDRQLSGVS